MLTHAYSYVLVNPAFKFSIQTIPEMLVQKLAFGLPKQGSTFCQGL